MLIGIQDLVYAALPGMLMVMGWSPHLSQPIVL